MIQGLEFFGPSREVETPRARVRGLSGTRVDRDQNVGDQGKLERERERDLGYFRQKTDAHIDGVVGRRSGSAAEHLAAEKRRRTGEDPSSNDTRHAFVRF